MTTTTSKAIAPFKPIEMETPEAVQLESGFTVKVKIEADPSTGFAYQAWTNERDRGTVSFNIDLFADAMGPGTDLKLITHSEPLVANQDSYDITLKDSALNTPPTFRAADGAAKLVYELTAVITLKDGANTLNGFAAFVGDALIQAK